MKGNLLPQDIAGLNGGDGYSFHKLLWNLFSDGPDRRRDFLYRFEAIKGPPTFYTVSEREPDDSENMWDSHPKLYDPKLKKGDRLSFTVRVNPVRSKRDASGRQQRHDVVMEAKNKIGFKNLSVTQRPPIATLIQDAGIDWLNARKTEYGFSFEDTSVRVDGYFQHKLFKGKGSRSTCTSAAFFEEGELASDSVIKDFVTTAADGKNYQTKFYNLDVIIAVGLLDARRGGDDRNHEGG